MKNIKKKAKIQKSPKCVNNGKCKYNYTILTPTIPQWDIFQSKTGKILEPGNY